MEKFKEELKTAAGGKEFTVHLHGHNGEYFSVNSAHKELCVSGITQDLKNDDTRACVIQLVLKDLSN